MNIFTMPTVGIAGFVERWEIVNKDGSIARACYVPQKNMILNSGLDIFPKLSCLSNYVPINSVYSGAYLAYFCIGAGTTLPAYTDTILGDEKYRGTCSYATWDEYSSSVAGASPYYMYIQRGIETPMGALDSSIDGEYGEIGFSSSGSTNGTLFSKFRIVDGLGNPTTIYVSSTQQLRMKYILRFQLTPDTQTHYTATITGLGSVGYTALWQYTDYARFSALKVYRSSYNNFLYAWSGTPTFGQIGEAFTVSGGSSSYVEATITPYVDGTYYVDNVFLFGVNDAVFTITSLGYAARYGLYSNSVITWALVLDTPIAKPNTHALSLTLRWPFARA